MIYLKATADYLPRTSNPRNIGEPTYTAIATIIPSAIPTIIKRLFIS
jgi:hypothetical protein